MIRLYTAKHCAPCHDITDLVKQGKVQNGDKVELIDIETDDGFAEFMPLVEEEGSAIPIAYKDGKVCKVTIEDGVVCFSCPG